MTTLQTLRFFVTPGHDCSYLPDRQAQTLFADPQAKIDIALYSELSRLGFRRSGNHLYRPNCKGCNACVSVRIPVQLFSASRSQKRVLSRNRDLSLERCPPQCTDEIYALYERYINERHADGDMHPPTPEQFRSFLVESNQATEFLLFRDTEGRLIAVAVIDALEDGLSAVYTFFDPDAEHRSLGTLAVLRQIEQVREAGLDYLYLGYWVEGCQKMDYKTRFKPLERLEQNRWYLDLTL